MSNPQHAFEELDDIWQLAFEEAWESWKAGSAAVGAVVSDGDGRIISRGRNRIADDRTEPGVLANTMLAHAEMNALAAMPLGTPGPLTVTTTYEPCFMCSAAITQNHIAEVRYAGTDPLFDGLNDWFAQFHFTETRRPKRTALSGPMGAFGHVLHVTWMVFWLRDGEVVDAHEHVLPAELAVARAVVDDGRLADVAAADGSVVDAVAALWSELLDLAT